MAEYTTECAIIKLARYLNQISECETHYDFLPKKVQRGYQRRAGYILEYIAREGLLDDMPEV